ncbi:MAG: hypothetical protein WBE92_01900, partial [Steroidobacteraceae bacterium]
MAPTSRSLTQALFSWLTLSLTVAGGAGGASAAGAAAPAGAASATGRAGHAAPFVKPSGTISWTADK